MIEHIERHIDNLKQKPDHIKKSVAFFTSLGVTVVIFGFWVSSFFPNTNVAAQANAISSPASAVGTTLTASVSDAASGVWDSVSGYAKSFFAGSNSANYKAPAVTAVPGNK